MPTDDGVDENKCEEYCVENQKKERYLKRSAEIRSGEAENAKQSLIQLATNGWPLQSITCMVTVRPFNGSQTGVVVRRGNVFLILEWWTCKTSQLTVPKKENAASTAVKCR